MKLLISALTKFILGVVLVGALVFLPAGSLNFFGGWLFMALLFIPVFILGVVLFIKSPSLLEKRLSSKEKEGTQKGVVGASALIFIIGFVLSGLDYRFGWTRLHISVSIAASVGFLLSYLLYAEVMRENAYLSRTVEVQENQTVVDTGLYGIVRHPMYSATILLFLSIPLVLGSVFSFAIFLVYPFIIAKRIKNEEELLEKEQQKFMEYLSDVLN